MKKYQYYLELEQIEEAKLLLEKHEKMSDFVREAIDREIDRRKNEKENRMHMNKIN